jgi:hypothetical protein
MAIEVEGLPRTAPQQQWEITGHKCLTTFTNVCIFLHVNLSFTSGLWDSRAGVDYNCLGTMNKYSESLHGFCDGLYEGRPRSTS